MKGLAPVCSALLAVLGAGCASDTDVLLECPSPDNATTAVLYIEFGGGAAGWAHYMLALQPANVPATPPKAFGRGPSVELLDVDDVTAMTLDWTDDRRLVVESAFGALTTVSYMFHQYPYSPTPAPGVRVLFNEHEPSGEERQDRPMKCRTAAREIVNPPPRRLRSG